ncbi:MAG: hypothetical protein ACLTCI_12445 [[Clostridium] nexile]
MKNGLIKSIRGPAEYVLAKDVSEFQSECIKSVGRKFGAGECAAFRKIMRQREAHKVCLEEINKHVEQW